MANTKLSLFSAVTPATEGNPFDPAPPAPMRSYGMQQCSLFYTQRESTACTTYLSLSPSLPSPSLAPAQTNKQTILLCFGGYKYQFMWSCI